ncbi:MAG: T9SS type A sorting domain-containing protein [Flavobacteriales bacterium]|nr:T9SS type A sorting domain-containing protein [Flavobacteriales bacterium]
MTWNLTLRLQVLLAAACLSYLAHSATAVISIIKPETCGNSNGELNAYISGSGAVGPYTYLWSNNATTASITGLAAGAYSVTITDALSVQYTANVTLNNVDELPFGANDSPSLTSFFDLLGITGGACAGECNGIISFPQVLFGGTPPFSVSFNVSANYLGTDNNGFPMYAGFCGGDFVTYTLTDALGCQGSSEFYMFEMNNDYMPVVGVVEGACADSEIGSIQVNQVTGISVVQLQNSLGTAIGTAVFLGEFESHVFEGLAPDTYTLMVNPMQSQCFIPLEVIVPDLGPGCTQVTGSSWYDADGDCVQDVGEVGIPGSVLVIEPGTQYAITGNDGSFAFSLPTGSYTLAQADAFLDPYCPAVMPAPFTISGTPVSIDLANNSTAPLDVRISAGCSNARPGFAHTISASAVNQSMQATGLVTVVCTIDPNVDYVSATPAPFDVSGDVITWQLAELDYFGTAGFSVETNVPVPTPLGTILTHSWTVSTANPDADLSDNADGLSRMVQGSYDPNDKTAQTSSRLSEALYYINEDEWIDYTIRFQNTGNAEALFVTVTDTLPEELDMTSFEMGVASHAYALSFKQGRVVEWFFDGINLPDSTSDESGSHGFIKFRIRPVQPLLAGTVIENIANIYFDFNPPVITEPSVLVAEFSTGAGERTADEPIAYPNPTTGMLSVSGVPADRLRIFSPDGKLLRDERVTTLPATINFAALAPGAYLLEVSAVGGERRTLRITKH